MEPNRMEFQRQCAFQSFCKRVLHNEACNAHEEIKRRRGKEVSFSDLNQQEARQLYTVDKYFADEHEAEQGFQAAGNGALLPYPIIVAATKGDLDAMKAIMQHFSGYIASLSLRKLYDERGNVYFGVEEDIRSRLG